MPSSQIFICMMYVFTKVSGMGYGVPGKTYSPGIGAPVYEGGASWYRGDMSGYRGGAADYEVGHGGYTPLGYSEIGTGYNPGQEIYAPRPYGFGYEAPDGFDNNLFHQEQGDDIGNVQGYYGYTDNQGVYRHVDYVSDAGGFRASVRTNEPGNSDGKESPAAVSLHTQPPLPGVYQQYISPVTHGADSYDSGSYKYGAFRGYGANYGLHSMYGGQGARYDGALAGHGGIYRHATGSVPVSGANYAEF